MYSQAIVRMQVRAMPCAERAMLKRHGAPGTGTAHAGRRAGGVPGKVVAQRCACSRMESWREAKQEADLLKATTKGRGA